MLSVSAYTLFSTIMSLTSLVQPYQVYHPNIDTEGNICLNILREDWKPVLSINSVVYGLNFLFLVRRTARHLTGGQQYSVPVPFTPPVSVGMDSISSRWLRGFSVSHLHTARAGPQPR
jgi:Ubiquitin-conjugating enzyme